MKKWQKTIISFAALFTLAAYGAQEGLSIRQAQQQHPPGN